MRTRQQIPQALATLAIHQADVVTTAQAREAGLSGSALARMLRDGTCTALGRGVVALTSAPTWEGLAWAGCLLGGESARLGPRASGFAHGLVAEAPEPVDVLIPFSSRVCATGPWQFVRERPGARSTRTTGSPPRLTAEDTVLDLSNGGSRAEVIELVTAATRKRLTTPARLEEAAMGRSRLRHRAFLADLLADVAVGVESPLELRYLHDVERAHGLPDGRRQRRTGTLSYRTDVRYDTFGLVVELDGRLGHEGKGRLRDLNRDNRHMLRSLRTLRYGWLDSVERPCVVARQVAVALALGGWPGPVTSCPRCRQVDERSWIEML